MVDAAVLAVGIIALPDRLDGVGPSLCSVERLALWSDAAFPIRTVTTKSFCPMNAVDECWYAAIALSCFPELLFMLLG
jgi:hypothetical protein